LIIYREISIVFQPERFSRACKVVLIVAGRNGTVSASDIPGDFLVCPSGGDDHNHGLYALGIPSWDRKNANVL
jgi:hypothetical protein